jgi:hypothetical protein
MNSVGVRCPSELCLVTRHLDTLTLMGELPVDDDGRYTTEGRQLEQRALPRSGR